MVNLYCLGRDERSALIVSELRRASDVLQGSLVHHAILRLAECHHQPHPARHPAVARPDPSPKVPLALSAAQVLALAPANFASELLKRFGALGLRVNFDVGFAIVERPAGEGMETIVSEVVGPFVPSITTKLLPFRRVGEGSSTGRRCRRNVMLVD